MPTELLGIGMREDRSGGLQVRAHAGCAHPMQIAGRERMKRRGVWEARDGTKSALQLRNETILITMLHWTITFLILALIAAFFGFGGVAGMAATLAKICFAIFLILFLVSLVSGRRSI